MCAQSAIDRFTSNAYDVVLDGESYRQRPEPGRTWGGETIPMTARRRSTAEELIRDLREARTRQLELFTDLSENQLLGVKGHFLEPPIWEVGHVGWFQEYWILRNLDKAKPLLENGDGIYDAFNVSYKLRWDHGFPSRGETLEYLRSNFSG